MKTLKYLFIFQLVIFFCPPDPGFSQDSIECTYNEIEVNNVYETQISDPILIKECTYGTLKSIIRSSADYKGRYQQQYEIYLERDGEYWPTINSDLFSNESGLLIEYLNRLFEVEYLLLKDDPENSDCLSDYHFQKIDLNQVSFSIQENGMAFHLSLGLSGACFAFEKLSVEIGLDIFHRHVNLKEFKYSR